MQRYRRTYFPPICWLGCILAFAVLPVAAQDAAGPQAALAALQRAQVQKMQQRQPDIQARWDRKSGLLTRLQGPLSEPRQGSAQEIALEYFAANGAMIEMTDPGSELRVVEVETDGRGWGHVKLQQMYRGLPVEGRQLVVSVSDVGQVRMVNCRHFVGSIAVDTAGAIASEAALERVRQDLAAQREADQTPTVEQVVYPHGGRVHLAWKVRLLTAAPLGDFIYYIDAHSGAVVNKYNNMKFALDRQTYTASNGTALPGALQRTEGQGAIGDTPLDNAHDFAGTVYNYYMTEHGRDSYDGAGATIVSTVHYGNNYNNAFWNGVQMVYGDGDGVAFSPLSNSLDVVAHELTHAVTDRESNLIYQNESGALNESLSDIFGVLIDVADWQIGEDVYTPAVGGDALRYMDDPARDGQQPDHMDDFVTPDPNGSALDQACNNAPNQDNGCVHINSGIPNKAAYLMVAGGTFHGVTVTPLPGGRTDMGRIFYSAQTTFLTPNSTFLEAKEATLDAVAAVFPGDNARAQTVRAAWTAVGVGAPNFALPASLSFGNVLIGESKTRPLTFTNNGDGDLVVSNITSSDGHFTPDVTSFTVTPGASRQVNVTFQTNVNNPGSQSGTLTVTHSGPNSPRLVALSGDAAVGLSLSEIDFGGIDVGLGKTQTITINNPAAVAINITAISTSNAQFAVSHAALPINLLAGASTDVLVEFEPNQPGLQFATLAVTHNPTILVSLSGGIPLDGRLAGLKHVPLAVPFGGRWMSVVLMCSCGCYALHRSRRGRGR